MYRTAIAGSFALCLICTSVLLSSAEEQKQCSVERSKHARYVLHKVCRTPTPYPRISSCAFCLPFPASFCGVAGVVLVCHLHSSSQILMLRRSVLCGSISSQKLTGCIMSCLLPALYALAETCTCHSPFYSEYASSDLPTAVHL